jgi:hypothetical protein
VIDKNVALLKGLADRHYLLQKGRVVWRGDSAALTPSAASSTPILACEERRYSAAWVRSWDTAAAAAAACSGGVPGGTKTETWRRANSMPAASNSFCTR